MGLSPSRPRRNTKPQVIGVGLPHTGTLSLSRALSLLYDNSPVYHGATQLTHDPSALSRWLALLKHIPAKTPDDRTAVVKKLGGILNGFVGATDLPFPLFLPELLALYPEAKFVCTVREPEGWTQSYRTNSPAWVVALVNVFLQLHPWMRFYIPYNYALLPRFEAVYGTVDHNSVDELRDMWDRHLEFVKKKVPANRLLFFDVEDGWGPLCEFLGREPPKDMHFPRFSDAQAIKEVGGQVVVDTCYRWLAVLGSLLFVVVGIVVFVLTSDFDFSGISALFEPPPPPPKETWGIFGF